MKPWEKIVAVTFLVLSFVQPCLSFLNPKFPGWKMFRNAEAYQYDLRAADGRQLNLRDYTLKRAYLLATPDIPKDMAWWLARRRPKLAPISGEYTDLTGKEPVTERFTAVRSETGEVQVIVHETISR